MANEVRLSSLRKSALALAACLMLAGCSSAAPTPITVYVTPAPTITPIIIYVTPAPTPTEAPTDTTMATATPTPSVTPSPAASPTSAAARCTGNASNKAFFVEAASKEPFDVYCAVLPSSWWLESGALTLPNGGTVTVNYKNAAGARIGIMEGAFCTLSPADCSSRMSTIGPASFAGLPGTLVVIATGITWGIYVDPGTMHAYTFYGRGMTQAQFVAWAAAVVKVPRP